VVTDRWQKWTDLPVDAATMNKLAGSCDEFLVGLPLLVATLGCHFAIAVRCQQTLYLSPLNQLKLA